MLKMENINKTFDEMCDEILFKLREISRFLEKLSEAKDGNECAPKLSN